MITWHTWINVNERMPSMECGTSGPMLVWLPASHIEPGDTPEVVSAASVFIADYHDGTGWIVDDGTQSLLAAPTHWMPLPTPPEVA